MRTCRHVRLKVLCLAGFAAIGAVIGGAGIAAAQPYNCSAGLTTVPEYCADDSDVGWGTPTCDPLVIQWADAAGPTPGDTVTITVRVQNTSSFNNVSAPPDPPAADLVAGETFTVGYSCPTGACASVNTGWLTGCTASNTHPDISFADNGDGTGTITIDNDIPLPAGDTAFLKLARISCTAAASDDSTPTGPIVAGANTFTEAASDSNGTMVVDDSLCAIIPLPGSGTGSAAGKFAPAIIPPPGDHTYCSHPNKQIIKLKSPLDRVKGRVGFVLPAYDPSTCDLTVGYDNLGGGPFSFATISSGSVEQKGRCYQYKDKAAKTGGGLSKVLLCPSTRLPDLWCLNYKGYGDIEPILLDPSMTISVEACGSSFVGPTNPPQQDPIWDYSAKKWVLPAAVWLP